MRVQQKSPYCGIFSCCLSPNVEIDVEQARLLAEEERNGAAENAVEKEAHFTKITVTKLMKIYDSCKRLVPDSKSDDWKEWFKEVAVDALKVAGAAALGATLGVFTAKAVGKGTEAKEVAISTGLAGALCALWDVKNEHTMRDKARGFLSLVEDVKLDRKKIEDRMTAIADALAARFQFAIHRLRNSEEGIGRLASFFTVAIAKGLPDSPESQKMSVVVGSQSVVTPVAADLKRDEKSPAHHSRTPSNNLTGQVNILFASADLQRDDKKISKDVLFRIASAVKYAIPEKEDSLYKNFWRKIRLETINQDEEWTIRGLLLHSPLQYFSEKDQKKNYYVRDGIIAKVNRADKYPPQVIMNVTDIPAFYLKVKEDSKEMLSIIQHQISQDPVMAAIKKKENVQPPSLVQATRT